jgi:Ring finger domain
MADSAVPPSASHETKGRIVVSITLVIALILLIIFASAFIQRHRPTITTFRPTGYLYMREVRQRKGIETFILESIPIVKYSTVLQRNEQIRVAEDYHSLSRTHFLRREVQGKCTYPDAAVAIIDEDEGGDTPLKGPGVPNSDKTSSKMHTIQNGNQQRPGHEPASCSICTEYFLDRENVRILPCAHIYHQPCIDSWLLNFSGTCPLW